MLDFLQDVRYGLRMLAKAPLVVAVAVVSLAAGIAANTTTFAVANGFLLAPFPYENQDELVLLREIHQKSTDYESLSPGNFLDYKEGATVFDQLVAYDVLPANVTGGEAPERVQMVTMSPETFSVLGRGPMIGRDFDPAEGVAGKGDVVVLNYPFWQRYFGQDRGVLGKSIDIDGKAHAIVGVMPEDFDFLPANVDLYRPTNWADRRDDRERSILAVGRLKRGKTVEEAQAELATVASRLASEHPEANEGYSVAAIGLRDYFPGRTDTRLMYILLTVASFVLLIACANIANLLLARAEERQREVAVRTALGAGRSRILRQLLTESVLLSLLGGALGTFGSVYAVRALRQSMPAELPRSFLPALDTTVLVYTLVISIFAGIVVGIAPALHTFGDDIREGLGETTRGGTVGRRRNRLRNAFVVAELAAALALLVGSGALVSVFDTYVLKDPGCRVEGVVTAQLNVAENRHPESSDVRLFYREVLQRIGEIPGVEAVAAMNELPRSRDVSTTDSRDRRAPDIPLQRRASDRVGGGERLVLRHAGGPRSTRARHHRGRSRGLGSGRGGERELRR